jgi:hypothetical protein
MEPSAFRRALRQPMPAAERDYLAAQFVGKQQPAHGMAAHAFAVWCGLIALTMHLQADTEKKQGMLGFC